MKIKNKTKKLTFGDLTGGDVFKIKNNPDIFIKSETTQLEFGGGSISAYNLIHCYGVVIQTDSIVELIDAELIIS